MTISTHIAIFITDYSEFCAEKFGTFGELSAKLLKNAGLKDEIRFYDAIKSQLPNDDELKDIKAIWITGSRSDAFDNEPWILNLMAYLQEKVIPRDDIRLVGICFGHQIISRALGSEVTRNAKGWEVGIESVTINKDAEVLELFKDFNGKIDILESHQDIVSEVPEGFTNLGSSERTECQGIYKKGKALTFQGHPEFLKDLVSDVLETKYKNGQVPAPLYNDYALGLQNNDHDGTKIGKVIVNFIESD